MFIFKTAFILYFFAITRNSTNSTTGTSTTKIIISLVKRTPAAKNDSESSIEKISSTNHDDYHNIVDSKVFDYKQKTETRRFYKMTNDYLHSDSPLLATNKILNNSSTNCLDLKVKKLNCDNKQASFGKLSKNSQLINSNEIPTKYSVSISYKKQVFSFAFFSLVLCYSLLLLILFFISFHCEWIENINS